MRISCPACIGSNTLARESGASGESEFVAFVEPLSITHKFDRSHSQRVSLRATDSLIESSISAKQVSPGTSAWNLKSRPNDLLEPSPDWSERVDEVLETLNLDGTSAIIDGQPREIAGLPRLTS